MYAGSQKIIPKENNQMDDKKEKKENPEVIITEGLDTDQIDRWIQ